MKFLLGGHGSEMRINMKKHISGLRKSVVYTYISRGETFLCFSSSFLSCHHPPISSLSSLLSPNRHCLTHPILSSPFLDIWASSSLFPRMALNFWAQEVCPENWDYSACVFHQQCVNLLSSDLKSSVQPPIFFKSLQGFCLFVSW